ncbi:MAG: tRNA lysidine(34) synthetase TilS [Ornithinibacter sp.]
MDRPWGSPDAATSAVRLAVRRALTECSPGDLVLVACSGGADSRALAHALAVEAPLQALRAGAVTVDHGIRAESASEAAVVAADLAADGLDPVDVAPVEVVAGPAGLEAAARDARYAALDEAAERHGAVVVLLGHTLDDQAEQVLLGLARGSGARSLSGMPAARGRYRRPLLGVTHAQTAASCDQQGLRVVVDPMNGDPAFARVRARRLLLDLEEQLGPGVVAGLARSASLLRADADHLDGLAAVEVDALGAGPWPVRVLAAIPVAVRSRVWRRALLGAGVPAGSLSSRHVDACDRLLTHWRGQGPVHVPGGLIVRRSGDRVRIDPRPRVE